MDAQRFALDPRAYVPGSAESPGVLDDIMVLTEKFFKKLKEFICKIIMPILFARLIRDLRELLVLWSQYYVNKSNLS